MVITDKDFDDFIHSDLKLHLFQLATMAYKGIVFKTPVKTGQARASWNLSDYEPDFTTVDTGGAPGAPLPIPETPDITVYFRKKPYPSVFIANGKPYIQQLENGSSAQAPAGMVAVTLEELKWAML